MSDLDLTRLNVGGINNDNSEMTPPPGWGEEESKEEPIIEPKVEPVEVEEKVETPVLDENKEEVVEEVKSNESEIESENNTRNNILNSLSEQMQQPKEFVPDGKDDWSEVLDSDEKDEEEEIPSTTVSPKLIEKNGKGKFIRHTRVDVGFGNRPSPLIVKSVFSRTLLSLLNTYFNGSIGKDGEAHYYVDEELKFFGVYNRKKESCAWEEGGADDTKGSVLLVTDPEGNPLTPSFSLTNTNVVNGKHALVPVWPGCYMLMGGQRKGQEILTVYKITSVESSIDAHLSSPSFTLDLICYSNGGEFTSNVESTFWNVEAPAWKAAMKRMYEKHAFVPAYVNDYKEFILDVATLNDLNDALSEPNFVNTIEVLPDLKTAYKVVGEQLGKEMLELDKYECAQLIVYPVYQQESVDVWILGLIYNRDTRSSAGRRIAYKRVVLHEDDVCQFYYPDRTEKESVPFDTLAKALKRNNGSIINAFRRLTPVV